jgi:hypothetical protein
MAMLWPSPAHGGAWKVQLAVVAGKVAVDTAFVNLHTRYSQRVISVNMSSKENVPMLALSKTALVKLEAGEEGQPLLSDPKDATVRMTMEVEVELVALYPLNEIFFRDGVLRLPTPKIVAGYAKPEGERGEAHYLPANNFLVVGWSETKKKVVQDSLAYAALNVARKRFRDKEEYKNLEEQLVQDFAREVTRLQKENEEMDLYEKRLKKAEQQRERRDR